MLLRGEAVEQADGELPYAPLLSALRPLVRAHHPALDALSAGSRAQLATILPGLDDGAPARLTVHDPSGQVRLFEALLELLDLLSEAGPVVLILEDMHWADRSTRTFVGFLARSLRQERVVLLLTYRTDELHRRHALRPLLAELDRLERARRIELEPFDREELTEALADILGDGARARSSSSGCSRAARATRCTPRSCWRPGSTDAAPPPQSLRDAFLLRIERLSADAQRAARAIAVGRRARRVDDRRGDRRSTATQLQAALREAVAEQVLVAGDDDALLLPPRAAARGAVRRPAARRARRAPPRAGAALEAGRAGRATSASSSARR